MSSLNKTHSELIEEISLLQQKIRNLEDTEAGCKKTLDALRASEEKYRVLLSESPDPTFSFTPAGQYTYVNRAFASGVGKAVEEIIGKTIWDVFSKDEAEKRMAPLMEVFRKGVQKVIEVRVPRPDGDRYYVTTITPVKNEKGEAHNVICSSKDITERKRFEEKLSDSEARFRTQYQNNPVPTFTWQQSGDTFILKDYNIAADVLTKGDAAKYLNLTAGEMYKNRPDILADMNRCFEAKTVVQRELVSESFKKPRILIVTWVFVGPDLIMAHLNDITRRRKAEEDHMRLQRRLQQAEKMEALGTLAGGVAHDLNNILGILVGYSELLLLNIPDASPLRNHVEKLMQGGIRAAAIVQDLLTLARRGIQTQNVLNLNAVISDYQNTPEFEHLRSAFPRVRIQFKLAQDLLNIKGSPSHISKTFMNLLVNAAEAMPEGGLLTVMTSNRHLDRPVQGYDDVREGDYVTLTVTDTGEGISDEDLKHIFEPFYTKKVMGRSGTGLGLAVVWGTVKDHQGYIDVQSKKGKGTTVTLYLPITRQEVTASSAALPMSDYLGREESILVVDDIREQRELASIMLGNLNYKVTAAASGEEALEYLKSHRVDLVVLDMIMDPGLDGLDTYKRILEIHPKQKAIIVSGFSESARVSAAQALGAGAYVRKPYIMEKLGVTVRNELDRKT